MKKCKHNYLNAFTIMTDEGSLNPEVVYALLPTLADAGVVLRVRVAGAAGGRGRGLHRLLASEHREYNVVPHHVEVPGDDGTLVLVLDYNLVRLEKT